jgi:hypothetical protein
MKHFAYFRYLLGLAILFAVTLTFAQSTGRVSLQLADGTVVKGRVLSQTDDEVTLDSTIGILTVKKVQLTSDSLQQVMPVAKDELSALRERVTQLEKIVAALQEENQALRATFAQQSGVASTASVAAEPTATSRTPTTQTQTLKYWMSSTGKRHNSNCRYFGVGNGHPCSAQEGVACKICGG